MINLHEIFTSCSWKILIQNIPTCRLYAIFRIFLSSISNISNVIFLSLFFYCTNLQFCNFCVVIFCLLSMAFHECWKKNDYLLTYLHVLYLIGRFIKYSSTSVLQSPMSKLVPVVHLCINAASQYCAEHTSNICLSYCWNYGHNFK